ncbi:MAG: hypothetical protein RJB18_901, partial [Pseudomonadota bacterium]
MQILRTIKVKAMPNLFGLALLCLLCDLAFADVAVDALPTGGQVVAGDAHITSAGTASAPVMNVNQTSQRAVVNWQSFDVGSGATVNFNQPNAQASTLNKIGNGSASKIYGQIKAPGEVILQNNDGVYFGKTSRVDVGSVVATSHSISDADYMAGKTTYDRNGATGSVINEGNIKTGLAGYVALLAPEVRNSGVIVAQMGTVVMAAGERITLNFDPSRHLASITATPSAIDALIENKNAVKAPGGLIILSARAVNSLVGGVIKQSGTLSASTDDTVVVRKGGRIMLSASAVTLSSGSRTVARGQDGGGAVEITASKTATVEATAKVSVSATENGNGGTIAIHADEKTTINGTLLAQSGKASGNGGTISTTSNGIVEIGATAEVKAGDRGLAPGQVGTWHVQAAKMDVNTTNAPVISKAVNVANVNIKVTSQHATTTNVAGELQNGELNIAADAVIQKTSPRLTNLTLSADNLVQVNGQILSAELSPMTLAIFADNKIEITQNAAVKVQNLDTISEIGLYNGDISSYFAGSNSGSYPIISLLARTLAIAGSVRSGSQNRAGSIKLSGQDSLTLENATIAASGSDGGNVEIVSMNGTVSLINSVVQTNGGEGRGGAISVAGLHDVALNNATLEATGTTQGGQVTVTSRAGDVNFLNAIIQTNGGSGLGGTISFDAFNSLTINGQLSSNSQSAKAGQITLVAKDILLGSQANLQATGSTGGGTILVGGDWQGSGSLRQATTVTMNLGGVIDASATQNGNGGKVVLWSDIHNLNSLTTVHGTIFAKAGLLGGNGGQVETSGFEVDSLDATVSTKSIYGKTGLWLIDPTNYTIGASQAGEITNALASNNLTITTSSSNSTYGATGSGVGDITVNSPIYSFSTNSLSLVADNNININADIVLNGNFSAQATNAININANVQNNGSQTYTGPVNIATNATLDTTFGISTQAWSTYNSTKTNAGSFSGAVKILVQGAAGGTGGSDGCCNGMAGGVAGSYTATYYLASATTLYVAVGDNGVDGSKATGVVGGAGGINALGFN